MGGCCCTREDRAKIVHTLAGTSESDFVNLKKKYIEVKMPPINTKFLNSKYDDDDNQLENSLREIRIST